MKLFTFVLFALAAFANAANPNTSTRALRSTAAAGSVKAVGVDTPKRKLGPAFPDEDVTMDREYNEEGQPPAGRQLRLEPDHPLEQPANEEKLMPPSSDEHDHIGDGHRQLYYNCYSYCWWDSWYGWVTYCCPYWGCGYYYC